MTTLDGGRVQLSKLRGHPVVVSFWATWCPSCRTEFPELARLYREHGAAGLYVLGVNGLDQEGLNEKKSTKKVQEFVDDFSLPFPVALDKKGRARAAYRLLGRPTTVFIDSGGVVRGVHRGPITGEELDRGVATIFPPG